MKKVMIIVAVALLILGAVVCVAAAASMHFDFKKMDNGNFETNTYAVKEKFSSISIDVTTEKVSFKPSDDGKCTVVCLEEEDMKHEVTVSGGTLTIKEKDERKWNDHFGFYTRTPEITVYLPESSYAGLTIETDTGDIKIPADFSFESVSIKGDTSDVECFASVEKELKIALSTGDIDIAGISAGSMDLKVSTGRIVAESVRCAGDVSANVSTGKVELKDLTCAGLTSTGSTGKVYLKNVVASDSFNITRSTGDIDFDGCDAGTIYVKTSTGDVKGTFLSDKTVFAETDTGKVKVPKSVSGGRCEITTDTGDIEIEIG